MRSPVHVSSLLQSARMKSCEHFSDLLWEPILPIVGGLGVAALCGEAHIDYAWMSVLMVIAYAAALSGRRYTRRIYSSGQETSNPGDQG